MFLNEDAISRADIELELTEAILVHKAPYFAIPPKQYLIATMGLGIKDFYYPNRAGRAMMLKMLHFGRLRDMQKKKKGFVKVERGSAFLHHATWAKYKQLIRNDAMLELNVRSLHAMTEVMTKLSLRSAVGFWTNFILEDMMALPYGVESMFFTVSDEEGENSPFGYPTVRPICIVNAEKLLPHLTSVMNKIGKQAGVRIGESRKAREQGKVQNMQSWVKTTKAAMPEEAIVIAKEQLASAYAKHRGGATFTPAVPLCPSWPKTTDYRYYKFWTSGDMNSKRMKELHIPASSTADKILSDRQAAIREAERKAIAEAEAALEVNTREAEPAQSCEQE